MNTTELYIAAGDAIGQWQIAHSAPCLLCIENGLVMCQRADAAAHRQNSPLVISRFEMERGMDQSRWNAIGEALHELYCKEITCQAHQKH